MVLWLREGVGVFLSELSTAGSLPALEMAMRFAGQRQRVLAHNVANLETPDFRPWDVDPTRFQQVLSEAVGRRRGETGGSHGRLALRHDRQIEQGPGGGLTLRPATSSGNILFHDRNNRDLERTMQDLVENATMYRVASELLRNRVSVLRSAISERVA